MQGVNSTAHLILEVNSSKGIRAKELFEMGSSLLSTLDAFCKKEKFSFNSNEVDVKLNLQSPGVIELSGVVAAVIVLAVICVVLAGGKAEFKVDTEGFQMKFKSLGILKAISSFLQDRDKRKLLRHMAHLQIKNPEELTKLINSYESDDE